VERRDDLPFLIAFKTKLKTPNSYTSPPNPSPKVERGVIYLSLIHILTQNATLKKTLN
jgi:hypothetical protein